MVAGLRAIASIVVSLCFALAAIIGVELLSNVVHPLPADFPGTQEALCLHVARYPQWVLAAATALWGCITLASTWMATRIGNRVCGILIGALLLAAVLFNLSMLPYPLWFKVANPVLFVAAIALGVFSSRRPTPAPPTAAHNTPEFGLAN